MRVGACSTRVPKSRLDETLPSSYSATALQTTPLRNALQIDAFADTATVARNLARGVQ
jgi:hypothetical protein